MYESLPNKCQTAEDENKGERHRRDEEISLLHTDAKMPIPIWIYYFEDIPMAKVIGGDWKG